MLDIYTPFPNGHRIRVEEQIFVILLGVVYFSPPIISLHYKLFTARLKDINHGKVNLTGINEDARGLVILVLRKWKCWSVLHTLISK